MLGDCVVKGERPVQDAASDLPPLGHLAECRGIEGGGHLRGHSFHCRKNGDLRLFEPEGNGKINSVLTDVYFVFQSGSNVDCSVRNDQYLVIRGNSHDEYVADSTPSSQTT